MAVPPSESARVTVTKPDPLPDGVNTPVEESIVPRLVFGTENVKIPVPPIGSKSTVSLCEIIANLGVMSRWSPFGFSTTLMNALLVLEGSLLSLTITSVFPVDSAVNIPVELIVPIEVSLTLHVSGSTPPTVTICSVEFTGRTATVGTR